MEARVIEETPRQLYSRLIKLALPIMAGNFVHTLYNMADTYFLGKLGKEAVAAPSIAFNIIMLLTVLGSSFGMAGSTLMSQAKGMGDKGKVDFYLGQVASLTLLAGGALMVLGLVFAEPLLALLIIPKKIGRAHV